MMDACWEAGLRKGENINYSGYGQAKWQGRTVRIHREVFATYYGFYPQEVMHSCDNRACYNPRHLVAGDHKANMEDMVRKGRGRGLMGSKHNQAKLTEESVVRIIQEIEKGGPRGYLGLIAERYGVSKSTIHLISKKRIWRHVFEAIANEKEML